MKTNNIILNVTDIIHGPLGVANFEGKTYHIKGAIPGDSISGFISKKKAGIHMVKVKELVQPSESRTAADCQHHPDCGGCRFRDIEYPAQLQLKKTILNNELRLQGLNFLVNEIIPAPNTHYYRNKMEFTFGSQEGNVILGMHKKDNFSAIVPTPHCLLQSTSSNRITSLIVSWANHQRLTAYDPRSHQGDLRHLIIREGKNTGQVMVGLVATREDLPELNQLAETLWHQVPQMQGFLLIINNGISDTVSFEKTVPIRGSSGLSERLADIKYAISLPSFFQTNTAGAELLYAEIKKLFLASGAQTLIDLYCGAGSIGMYCAGPGHQVVGVEINEAAIADALINQEKNQLTDVTFHCQDVKTFLSADTRDLSDTLVVIDPPREGLHPKTKKILLEKNVEQIIYVSCNPKTLAIDLKYFSARYSVQSLKAFDLFPFTPHLEIIVLLKKTD